MVSILLTTRAEFRCIENNQPLVNSLQFFDFPKFACKRNTPFLFLLESPSLFLS